MSHSQPDLQSICVDKHSNLRVNLSNDHSHFSSHNSCAIVADEITQSAANFPVAFVKDPESGRFQLSALFGLLPQENLFVGSDNKWLGTYLPTGLSIMPFGVVIGEGAESDWIKIDANSTCLSCDIGQPLFEQGQPSHFYQDMRQQISTLIDASSQTEIFIENLVNRNLLTEMTIVLTDGEGKQQVINDLYTINVDEFAYLTQEDVMLFHRLHYWRAIYAIEQSVHQFKRLSQLKNRQAPMSLSIHIEREED